MKPRLSLRLRGGDEISTPPFIDNAEAADYYFLSKQETP